MHFIQYVLGPYDYVRVGLFNAHNVKRFGSIRLWLGVGLANAFHSMCFGQRLVSQVSLGVITLLISIVRHQWFVLLSA